MPSAACRCSARHASLQPCPVSVRDSYPHGRLPVGSLIRHACQSLVSGANRSLPVPCGAVGCRAEANGVETVLR